jgi:hypothetical protein
MTNHKTADITAKSKAVGIKSILVKSILAAFFLVTLPLLVLSTGSVDNSITESDKRAIIQLGPMIECVNIEDFESELNCARAVQNSIKVLIPNQKCAKLSNDLRIEPENFIKRGYGCCYSRARFTEKTLRYYGFKTRRVAIHVDGPYGVPGTLMLKTVSHATTEVLTSRGWMGVDSNESFILITRSGQPLTFKNFKSHHADLEQKPIPESFYQNEYTVVYGLYSRHGKFHGAFLPVPEFNYQEVFYNF